jgi:lipopolysaccharide transport system permease protein
MHGKRMSTQIELPDALMIRRGQQAGVEEPVKPLTVIRPPQGWQPINIRELWQFRELIYFLAWRDVKIRYKQTALGAAWAVLQPAMMMVVFTLFFGRMAGMGGKETAHYPLFVLAALLPWTFFATALTGAANSVVGSERLITKIYFPRLVVPFAVVGAALVDFLVSCGLMAGMMTYYQVAPTWNLLLAPLVFAIVVLAALGLGTLLAALNVAYRDFRYVIPFLIQVGMFATPTIYTQPAAGSGRMVQVLLLVNPMTSLIAAFRVCVLGGEIPWEAVGVATALATGLFLVGCSYFRWAEDGFADII